MKTSLSFAAGALLALTMQAVCFAQHYMQTNLVSNTSGVAPVTLSPGNDSPTNSDAAAAPAAQVYFTAGPTHGSGGLFGYLAAVSSELTEGSNRHSCFTVLSGWNASPQGFNSANRFALGLLQRGVLRTSSRAPQQAQVFRSIEGPVQKTTSKRRKS